MQLIGVLPDELGHGLLILPSSDRGELDRHACTPRIIQIGHGLLGTDREVSIQSMIKFIYTTKKKFC